MTKPILWLGPLEELDADFDPLLGRSATQAQPQSRPSIPKPMLDPSRSVFDDPVEETPNNSAPVAAILDAQTEQNDASLTETGWPASQGDLEPAPVEPSDLPATIPTTFPDDMVVVEETIIADPEPAVGELAAEPVTQTDFTHNNDPIPAGKDAAAPIVAVSAQEPERDALAPQEPVAPKKSFFASLFSSRDAIPAETRDSASINDIWAKSANEPAPQPTPEPEVEIKAEDQAETELGSELEPEPAPAPESNVALDPLAPIVPYAGNTPLRGRNIWADIDTQAEAEQPSPVMPAKPELQADADDGIGGEDNIASDTVLVDAIETSEAPEVLKVVEVEAVAESLVDARALEPDSSVAPEALAPNVDQPAVEPALQVTNQSENTSPSLFQNAFNADQFWALPRGTNPPQSEPLGPEPLGPEPLGPEPLSPEAQRAEPQDPISAPASPDVDAGDEVEVANAPDIELQSETIIEGQNEADATVVSLPQEEPTPAITAPIAAPKVRVGATGKRRKKKVKKNYIGAVLGTSLFMFALIMTLVSGIAAFGYPFDMISSYRWYWVILSVLAAGIFGVSRGWKMVAASFIVMAANLFVTVPATGKAPTGGNTATAVVGWANVAGNSDALARVFKDAQKKKATLLMLAEAPQSVFTPPAGWTLIEAPIAGDPTAIAVLSNSTWRAVTVPGEPTMARPAAGDITIIALHPHDALKGKRTTPIRDAQINRAGTRAGYQEGPTVVLGDFNVAPWDNAISQFRSYGNVTRVRCGGWAASTLTQAFGFIGVATDHAFVRDVTVTHCQLGSPLTGGNHKPIWLYVAPQVEPVKAAPAL